jgi:hypothetical protein
MMNLNEIFNESELVDAQLFDGFPVAQLRIKEGLIELPLDQFAGLMADDVEIRNFEHGDTIQQGYALQSLLMTVLVAQTSYTVKIKIDPKNPKSESETISIPNYVNGAKSRLRALCLSPQIGTTNDGEFIPKPFIITIGGLQTKAFNQVFGYKSQQGEFFKTIARPLAMLISPSGAKSFPDYSIACPVGFGAKQATDLPDGSKLHYYPLACVATKDDTETIKQLESMRPKAPSIGKAMPESVKASKLKKYNEELMEFKSQAIAVIEKSELSRLFVGYHKFVPLLADEIEKYNQQCVEFEDTQREHKYYDFLTHFSQYRLPKGIEPMEILQNECDGDISRAIASIEASIETSNKFKALPSHVESSPVILSDVMRLQLELDR